jgi:hypothetical protein
LGHWIVGLADGVARPAQADEPKSFDSCAGLRAHIEAMQPYEQVVLAPNTFTCKEPPTPRPTGCGSTSAAAACGSPTTRCGRAW